MRPRFPSWMRSESGSPRYVYCFAMLTTSRRFALISACFASSASGPLSATRRATSNSSSRLRSGISPIVFRYLLRSGFPWPLMCSDFDFEWPSVIRVFSSPHPPWSKRRAKRVSSLLSRQFRSRAIRTPGVLRAGIRGGGRERVRVPVRTRFAPGMTERSVCRTAFQNLYPRPRHRGPTASSTRVRAFAYTRRANQRRSPR